MTYLSSDWQINFLAIVYDKRIFVASYCNVLFKSDLGEALFDRQRKNLTAGVMQSKKGMNVMNGGKIIINRKKNEFWNTVFNIILFCIIKYWFLWHFCSGGCFNRFSELSISFFKQALKNTCNQQAFRHRWSRDALFKNTQI